LRAVVASLCALVLLGGAAVSSFGYVRPWSQDFAGRLFVSDAVAATRQGPLHVLDSPVPDDVLSGVNHPYNLPSRFFRPLGDRIVASTTGTDLYLLDGGGNPRVPAVVGGAVSPPGPAAGCGYAIGDRATPIALEGAPRGYFWTMRLAYVSGADGSLELTFGGTRHELPVEAGAHAVFLQSAGSIEDLRMRTTSSGQVVCVDQVAFGDPEPLA
jgi:hypothetical protein